MDVQLTFVTPATLDELNKYYDDARFLYNFFPTKLTPEQTRHIIEGRLGNFTIAYANGIVIGAFMYDHHKTSLELHGVVRADLNKVIPNAKRVKQYIFNLILQDIFDIQLKEKVIIKAPYSNKGVRGFALMYGFKKLKYLDKGNTVWVLTKEQRNEWISPHCSNSTT